MLDLDPCEASRVRRLWCAVLQRALDDALGAFGDLNSSQTHGHTPQAEAIAWFRAGRAWFRQVCWMADLDPDVVQARALAMIERGAAAAYDKRKQKAVERWMLGAAAE